jgi:membrane-associated phospholipid phosphatase
MPSLHTAFATIIALFVAQQIHSRWRWLLVLYPIAMGCSLVYLGEHYVIDLLAGVGYALAVHVLVSRWERRRRSRRGGSGASSDPGAHETRHIVAAGPSVAAEPVDQNG